MGNDSHGIDKPFALALEINPSNTAQVFLGTAGNRYRTDNVTAPVAANVVWTKSNYGLKYTAERFAFVQYKYTGPFLEGGTRLRYIQEG